MFVSYTDGVEWHYHVVSSTSSAVDCSITRHLCVQIIVYAVVTHNGENPTNIAARKETSEAACACGNKRIAVKVSRMIISYHTNSYEQRSVQARLAASRRIFTDWQTVADSRQHKSMKDLLSVISIQCVPKVLNDASHKCDLYENNVTMSQHKSE